VDQGEPAEEPDDDKDRLMNGPSIFNSIGFN
jgi:hypothetical protein